MLTTFYHFLPHLNNIIDFIKSQANLKKYFNPVFRKRESTKRNRYGRRFASSYAE